VLYARTYNMCSKYPTERPQKLGKTPASYGKQDHSRNVADTSRPWSRRHISKSGTAPRLVTTTLFPVRDLSESSSSSSVCQQPASSFTSAATYSSHLKVKANHNKHDLHKPQHMPIPFLREVRLVWVSNNYF
jgi:hypothetical protein